MFDKSIVIGTDFDEFKRSGLLLYFQETDGICVNVVTANLHDTYMLKYDGEDLWELKDEPNQFLQKTDFYPDNEVKVYENSKGF